MMRALIALALLAPASAWADPFVLVGAAVKAIAGAAGFTLAAGAVTAISAAIVAGTLAWSAARARRRARDAANAALRDSLVTVRSSVEPRRVVLGRRRVGGVVCFHGSVGEHKEKFVMVVALAGHECESIDEVWFNDEAMTLGGAGSEYVQNAPYARTDSQAREDAFTGDGVDTTFVLSTTPGTGTVSAWQFIPGGEGGSTQQFTVSSVVGTTVTLASAPTGAFKIVYQITVTTSYARVRKFLGAPGQTVDAVVNSLFPAAWDSTHPMSGCAGLAVIFDYSEDAYPAGLPNISAVVKGAKCYDPRLDSTAGGSGAHREADPSTWEWTEYPPSLVHYYAHSALGARLPMGSVDLPRMAVALNVCDLGVDYSIWATLTTDDDTILTTGDGDAILATSDGEGEDPLYTAGIVATTAQRPVEVIDELVEAMAGRWAFVGNKLVMVAGAYVEPVLTLDESSFAGGAVSVQARVPREQLFNTITARFLDAAQDWHEVDMPRVQGSAYVTDDNGVELVSEAEYGAVTRAGQAQQVSAIRLRQSRQALTVVARFNLAALPVELFDAIALTNARFGWDAKPFEVLRRKWSLDGLIELALRETAEEVYDFGAAFDEVDSAPNTNLTLPGQIEQLTGLAVESGTAELADGSIVTRTRVSWTATADLSVLQGGKVEIQFHKVTDLLPPADWPSQKEEGGATEATIVGLLGGRGYVFRARFIGSGGRVRGPWSGPYVVHTVAAPPRVGGQNLFVNPSFELDTSNIADHWQVYTSGTTGSVSHSDAAGIFGDRAQRVDCTNLGTSSSDRAGYAQGVNVTGFQNRQVTLSVYAEGTAGAKARLWVDWYTALGGSIISNSSGLHTLTTDVQRFADTFLVPTGCTLGVAHFWIEQRPSAPGAAYLRIDAAQFEEGSAATAFAPTADEALAVAAEALATAEAAALDAADALAQLSATASDNVLSKGEKGYWVGEYSEITGSQAGIDAQATAYGITTEKTAYDDAIADLTAYLATVTGWNTLPGSDVVIVGSTWRSTWLAVYLARQTLLNKIAEAAGNTNVGPGRLVVNIGGGNLLFNAGFETAGTAATNIGPPAGTPGWYQYNNSAGTEPSTYTRVTGRTSGAAIRHAWTGTNTTTKGVHCTGEFAYNGATPGVRGGWQATKTYMVSFYARASAGASAAFALAWNTAPATTTQVLHPSPSSSAWQRYAWRITWGASVEPHARLYPHTPSAVTGWVEIDDVQVEEGDVLTAWAPGSIGAAVIEPNSATELGVGALDAGPYNGGYVGDPPGTATFTPTADCVMKVVGTAEIGAINSSGSTAFVRGGVSVQVNGSPPTTSSSGFAYRRNVANGETWAASVVVYGQMDVTASTPYDVGLHYSDHVSATQTSTLTNARVSVEFIKR